MEVGGAVAVEVAGDGGGAAGRGVAELTGDAGVEAGADEAEGLVAGGAGVGVDRRRVDPVPWAWLKSVIRSALAPTALCEAAVNTKRSAPAGPVIVSFPAQPFGAFAKLLPVMVSAPEEPLTFSMLA